MKTSLADLVRFARRQRGLPTYEVVLNTRITVDEYQALEEGAFVPSHEVLQQIAVLLDFDLPEELAGKANKVHR